MTSSYKDQGRSLGSSLAVGNRGDRERKDEWVSPPKKQPPPPLDLTKTRAAYPTTAAFNVLTAGTNVDTTGSNINHTSNRDVQRIKPTPKPIKPITLLNHTSVTKATTGTREAKGTKGSKDKRPIGIPPPEDDPFNYDFAEIEPGHKYTSWKGGKVDIRPGEIIPRGTIPSLGGMGVERGTPTIRGIERLKAEDTGDGLGFESVLHNVLLTPTYLRRSPSMRSNRDGDEGSDAGLGLRDDGSDARGKNRFTMVDKAREVVKLGRDSVLPVLPKGILKFGKENEAEKSVREMKEREVREMERFRGGELRYGKSERELENGYGRIVGYEGESLGNEGNWGKEGLSWRERKRNEDKLKRKQRVWKVN